MTTVHTVTYRNKRVPTMVLTVRVIDDPGTMRPGTVIAASRRQLTRAGLVASDWAIHTPGD